MKRIYVPDTMLCASTKQVLKNHFKIVEKPEDADAICFTGGEDINPEIYNDKCMNCTYFNPNRDELEIGLYNLYNDKKFIGICRGAQLLAALKGMDLVQDISSAHPYQHMVDYYRDDGKIEKVAVNSYHHQAIIEPNDLFANISCIMSSPPIRGWVFPNTKEYPYEDDFPCMDMFKCENVFGVQYHPELSGCSQRGIDVFIEEVKKFLEE